jgi:hypothetical protein
MLMPGTPTTKYALPTMAGADAANTIDTYSASLATALDGLLTPSSQGAKNVRPTSTVGTPGKLGRTYLATDTGEIFYDYGTGWAQIGGDEATRLVGVAGQPAFENGWANYGGGEQPVGFYRSGSRVYLQGAASNTSSPSATSIFTLPTGYRPGGNEQFVVMTGATDVPGRIIVASAGQVLRTSIGSSSEPDYTSLAGISFRVA